VPLVNLLPNMFSIDHMCYVNFIIGRDRFGFVHIGFVLDLSAPCRAFVVCHARFVFNKVSTLGVALGTLNKVRVCKFVHIP